jgi:hypothetical protein
VLHIVSRGVDQAIFVRALETYLSAWGQSPVVIDLDTIPSDEYGVIDSYLTMACPIVIGCNPSTMLQWLKMAAAEFYWYEIAPPSQSSDIHIMADRLQQVRKLGGVFVPVLSKHFYQRTPKNNWIFLPIVDELGCIDWTKFISDRASNPFLRDRLYRNLFDVFGDIHSLHTVSNSK